jgi:AsmA family protein
MRLKTILIAVLVLLVVVVGGVVVLVMSIDFNQYKGLIAEQVKQATGRELAIGGDFKLALSLTPTVAVDNVSFANAPGGTRPQMVTLKRLEVQMQLLPLLSRQIKVNRLVLDGADILLETDAKGRGNWVFTTGETSSATSATTTSGGSMALPQVDLVQIRDSIVTYHDGVAGTTRSFRIDKLNSQAEGGRLKLDLAAVIGKAPITAQGSVGSPDLLAGGAPYPFDLAVTSGDTSATVKGAIGDVTKMQGIAVDISAKGKALSDLSELTGAALPPLGPYSFAGKATDVPGGYKISGFTLTMGESSLGGDLALALGKKPKITANLTADKIDAKDFGVKPAGTGNAGSGGSASSGDGRIFPATPIPFAALIAVDADVNFTAKQLIKAPVTLTGVKLTLALAAGKLQVKPFSAGIGGGTLVVNLTADGSKSPAPIALDLNETDVEAGNLLQVLAGTAILTGGKANLKINVTGAGNSVRAIMAGLNGKFDYNMGAGNINNSYAKLLLADLFKLLSFGSSGDSSNLKCVVGNFDISRGLATSRQLAVETSGATIIGKGTINLATEGLDIHLTPYASAANLAQLAIPVIVGGTMANPHVVPDAAAMATGAVGTVVGAPLTALSTIGNVAGIGGGSSGGTTTGAGCGSSAAPAQGQAKPAQQPSAPAGGAIDTLGGGAKGATDTLKSLLP